MRNPQTISKLSVRDGYVDQPEPKPLFLRLLGVRPDAGQKVAAAIEPSQADLDEDWFSALPPPPTRMI
jgi:hypothetical protein